MKSAAALSETIPNATSPYAPDQPLAELGFAEQFLIWSLRVQWRAAESGDAHPALLHRAFDAMELPGGATMVAELATALMRSVERPLSIPCPRWRVLTSDEVRILNFMSALQRQDATSPMMNDMGWRAATPCGASHVWAPAQRLALAFTAAGLVLGSNFRAGMAFPEAMPRLLH